MQQEKLYIQALNKSPTSLCVTFSSHVFALNRGLLMGLDCGMQEHEVLALGQSISECKVPEVDVGLTLAVKQDFLKKKHFDKLPQMTRAFKHQDQYKQAVTHTYLFCLRPNSAPAETHEHTYRSTRHLSCSWWLNI